MWEEECVFSRIDLECRRVLMCLPVAHQRKNEKTKEQKKILLPLTIAYLSIDIPTLQRANQTIIRGSTTHLRVRRLRIPLFLYLSTYFLLNVLANEQTNEWSGTRERARAPTFPRVVCVYT